MFIFEQGYVVVATSEDIAHQLLQIKTRGADLRLLKQFKGSCGLKVGTVYQLQPV